jgi:hypothetical protein
VRWPLYALPVVTLVVVALALVTAGSTRPYRVARVWGGPTEGARLGLRVETFDIREDLGGGFQEVPVSGGKAVVEVESATFRGVRPIELDVEGGGEASFELPPGHGRVSLLVEQAGQPLAQGELPRLTQATWAQAARRRGGWVEGSAGPFVVRAAPARGVLAVPFEEELWIAAERAGRPASGVRVRATSNGATLEPNEATLDARGRAVLRIVPREHTLGVTLRLDDATATGDVTFDLPVVPGALRASVEQGELRVEAPVPRDIAYFALVTPNERLFGGRLLLRPDGRGGSSARFALPALVPSPTHAVVSSERDLRSPAAVGWPLVPSAGADPATTFDAVDALLLDGRPRAALRERARRSRVRWTTGAFCALALLVEVILLARLTRTSDRRLDRHLEREGIEAPDAARLAPRRSPTLLLALALVALGFFVMAIVAILRLT